MTDEKIDKVYYQPDHLWTGVKAVRELYKITSVPKKDFKPWLAKQALWHVHITLSNKNKSPSLQCYKT